MLTCRVCQSLVIFLTSQLQHQPLKSDYNDPFWTLSRATLSLEKKVYTFVLLPLGEVIDEVIDV